MKRIDRFLEQHQIDVGRSLGLLSLTGAVVSVFEIVGQLFIGHIDIDLTAPLGLVLGLALWRHASWARTTLIVITWAVAGILASLLAILPVVGTARLRLTIGSTEIQQPPLWQVYFFATLLAPIIWFVLSVLHSARAKAEFGKIDESAATANPPATPASSLAEPNIK